MFRKLSIWAATLGSLAAFAAVAHADVILRGPFGGLIIVPSSSDVRVGPAGVAVVPVPVAPVPVAPVPVAPGALPAMPTPVAPQTVTPVPVPLPAVPVPQPASLTPILPQDFVKTFQPRAGAYQVVFLHPRSKQPVTVAFVLPAGNPRVSYFAHSLLFDYGRHEVEIRFQIGGKVKVVER